MQNPFTTTFSKLPEYSYINRRETDEILENFSYQNPSESVYKITGIRGSGKTVILAKIEEELRNVPDWIILDINSNRNMLQQIAARLNAEGFGKTIQKGRSLSISANILGTGSGIGISDEKDNHFFDIGVEIEYMLQKVQKNNKKLLFGIDEVSKTPEMICFASEFGKWLRAGYPVYLVCTGLYENIKEVSNVKNLTFFLRATTIKASPLDSVGMIESYKKNLNIDYSEAYKLARLTKGYAYAFQIMGVLYFRKAKDRLLDDIIPEFKSQLYAYSYEKISEELSDGDRLFISLMTDKNEYKRAEMLQLMGDKANNYSVYRDRLIKKGILTERQGYISFTLPFFREFAAEYLS